MTTRYCAALFAGLTAILLPALCPAQDLDTVINQEQQKAAATEERIESLEQEESSVQQDVVAIEAEVRALRTKIEAQEKLLADIETQEQETKQTYLELQARRSAIGRELTALIRSIWPLHMKALGGQLSGAKNWAEADRRYTWLTALYTALKTKLDEATETSRLMAENLESQKRLAEQARAKLTEVNTAKDELLRQRYALRKQMKDVRAERESLEGQLKATLALVEELNYRIDTRYSKNIADHKHALPWPVAGSVIATFAPKAKPPRRGVGLRVTDGTTVKSIFWGKVVHNDTMRGFGRVVIVYHGHDYYSLYAFLSESPVTLGQEVEKDEALGTVGYYPQAEGSGLYFELRFKQKPINPVVWLIPR